MPKVSPYGTVDVVLTAGEPQPVAAPHPDTPFRILILGDWSGRARQDAAPPSVPLAQRRPRLVDRDNLDEVLAVMRTGADLSLAGAGRPHLRVGFATLDDFHPDRLVERLEVFRVLRERRGQLEEPSTFAAAAADIWTWLGSPVAPEAQPVPPRATPSSAGDISGEDLLEQIVGSEDPARATEGKPLSGHEWQAFLRDLVGPHLVSGPHPDQDELIGRVDAAIGETLRQILHAPEFQHLEAAWRGLAFLTQRLETGTRLQLYILDVSREELVADLQQASDPAASDLYRVIVEQSVGTPGAEPWAVLAGLYTFDRSSRDVELLGRLGRVAEAAGAPILLGGSPRLVGCRSFAVTPDPADWGTGPPDKNAGSAWDNLRRSPAAAYVGLALPRFLLRLPYGPETEPVAGFEFEEMPDEPRHEDYLWGNPSLACVYLLAVAFSQSEWGLRPGQVQEIDGLPLHVYQSNGETVTKPCAEALLTERGAEVLLDHGLMPLLSFKNADGIRLARCQSLASPPRSLAGRWM